MQAPIFQFFFKLAKRQELNLFEKFLVRIFLQLNAGDRDSLLFFNRFLAKPVFNPMVVLRKGAAIFVM
jgi:hypothetical protein